MCEGIHPYIPVPNTLKVELIQQHQGQVVENVYHCEYATDPSTADANVLAAAFRDWWTTNIAPLVSTNTALTLIRLTNLTTQTGFVVEFSTGLPAGGLVTGDPMPGNVTLAMKWTTDQRGKSQRGRTYHIGFAEGQVTGNTVLGTVVTNLIAAYRLLTTTALPSAAELTVVSYCSNKQWRLIGQTTPITNVASDGFVDSQRRRLTGRGN